MPSNSTAPQGGADEPTRAAVDGDAAPDATGADSVDPDAMDQSAPDYAAAAALGRAAPRRPATEAEARALASAIRLRIMRLCLDRPLTNKEIAERLGANPATTLHHVRTLVATGFLAAQK